MQLVMQKFKLLMKHAVDTLYSSVAQEINILIIYKR